MDSKKKSELQREIIAKQAKEIEELKAKNDELQLDIMIRDNTTNEGYESAKELIKRIEVDRIMLEEAIKKARVAEESYNEMIKKSRTVIKEYNKNADHKEKLPRQYAVMFYSPDDTKELERQYEKGDNN